MSAIFECPDCGQVLYFPAIPCFMGLHVMCGDAKGEDYKRHPGVYEARRAFLETVKQRETEQKQFHESIQQLNDLIMYHPGLQGPGFRAAQDHFETGRKRLRSDDDDSHTKRPKSTTDTSTSDRVADDSTSNRVTGDSERVCKSLDSEEE